MIRWTVLCCCLFNLTAYAVDENEERAIAQMLKNSSLTRKQLLEHYKTGCESGITYPMRICAAYQFYEADVELNDTYKRVIKGLSKFHKDKLVLAQRAWVQYRDATCDYESSHGGSADGMYFSSCRTQLTKERIARLLENSPVSSE